MDLDFTTVVGTDRKYLPKLLTVMPSWYKHKPSLWQKPMILFYDAHSLSDGIITRALYRIDAPIHPMLRLIPWTHNDYPANPFCTIECDKWYSAQRYKMFAGYLHIPAQHVKTPWWLNLAADIIATGIDDWILHDWFVTGMMPRPAMIGHAWRYTKPPNRMLELDAWVEKHADQLKELSSQPPLNLVPDPDSGCLSHDRIESFCSLFSTEFTQRVSRWCEDTCGEGKLPVCSQDSTLWYCAKRLGMPIVRLNLKKHGWGFYEVTKIKQRTIAHGK